MWQKPFFKKRLIFLESVKSYPMGQENIHFLTPVAKKVIKYYNGGKGEDYG